ncbi:MAG: hypothetical protein GXO78_06935, partial [Calditrichaeota bacterium]|nr:hypothetical protein [Calditrichota bacterium]
KKTNLVSDVHILNHFDDIFVVFVMGGYFLRYNILHKKVFFLSQTIVPVDFPEVEQPNPYVMRISPERKISAFSASIADGKLMIFSYRALQQSIADFYSLKQGRYKFSVMLERKYLDLRYHSERIYSLYKQGVDIYAVENGSD